MQTKNIGMRDPAKPASSVRPVSPGNLYYFTNIFIFLANAPIINSCYRSTVGARGSYYKGVTQKIIKT